MTRGTFLFNFSTRCDGKGTPVGLKHASRGAILYVLSTEQTHILQANVPENSISSTVIFSTNLDMKIRNKGDE